MSRTWPSAAPWFAAAAGWLLATLAFHPGYLSFDSAEQWWQARHGAFTTLHPPLMALFWSGLDALWPGPGAIFQWHLLVFWASLAVLFAALPLRPRWRALGVLAVGLFPPVLAVNAHIWKDVPTAAALLLALACLRFESDHRSPWWSAAALLALAYACAMRHNAIFAVVPLLIWLAFRWTPATSPRRVLHGSALALLLTALVTLLSALPARLPSVHKLDSLWAIIALWDFAGVSLREGELVYPPGFAAEDLTLAELDAHFRPWANVPIFDTGKLDHPFDTPYTDGERAALLHGWLRLPLDYPGSYFAHRGRLTMLQFGFDPDALPTHQVLQPGVVALSDNPPVPRNYGALNRWLQPALDALIRTPLFAGWAYLAIVLACGALAWRRHGPAASLALATAASALAYVAPLTLIAGSAEFRYLHWLVVAALALPWLLAGTSPAGRKMAR